MTSSCPRPCSKLVMAAIFLSIGVIQFLVGVILLKSQYASLLCGPIFITAVANVTSGCILGFTASIWQPHTKKSIKHITRKNLTASFFLSVIVMNVTASIVLIVGEGSKLLSIRIEDGEFESTTFANEILACAYVASVCSPVVCTVVAIVALSGNFFQDRGSLKSIEDDCIFKTDSYFWVFDTNTLTSPKSVGSALQTPKKWSSSDSEGSVFPNRVSATAPQKSRNPFLGLKTPSPVRTWTQKRARLLKCQPDRFRKRTILFQNSSASEDTGEYRPSPLSIFQDHDKGQPYFENWDPNRNFVCENDYEEKTDCTNNRYSKLVEKHDSDVTTNSLPNFDHRERVVKAKKCMFAKSPYWDFPQVHKREVTYDNTITVLRAATVEELKKRTKNLYLKRNYTNHSPSVEKEVNSKKSRSNSCSSNDSFNSDETSKLEDLGRSEVSALQNTLSKREILQERLIIKTPTITEKFLPSSTASNSSRLGQSMKNAPQKPLIGIKIQTNSIDEGKSIEDSTQHKSLNSTVGAKSKNIALMEGVVNQGATHSLRAPHYAEPELTSTCSAHLAEQTTSRLDSSHQTSPTLDKRTESRIENLPGSIPKTSAGMLLKNLLRKRWSSPSTDKLNISHLIVDPDSLIGLSEDQLMERTQRIRSLKKEYRRTVSSAKVIIFPITLSLQKSLIKILNKSGPRTEPWGTPQSSWECSITEESDVESSVEKIEENKINI